MDSVGHTERAYETESMTKPPTGHGTLTTSASTITRSLLKTLRLTRVPQETKNITLTDRYWYCYSRTLTLPVNDNETQEVASDLQTITGNH